MRSCNPILFILFSNQFYSDYTNALALFKVMVRKPVSALDFFIGPLFRLLLSPND